MPDAIPRAGYIFPCFISKAKGRVNTNLGQRDRQSILLYYYCTR